MMMKRLPPSRCPLAAPRSATLRARFAGAALVAVLTAAASGGAQAALGDAAADLTFVPITPCRIVDTRFAGGPLVAGGTRDFVVSSVADYSAQGGEANTCSGMASAGAVAAVAVNFTVMLPNVSGTLKAWPTGATEPTAIATAYAAGETRTNFAVVKLAPLVTGASMTLKNTASAHLTVDAVGYYIAPQATPPQCVATSVSTYTIGSNRTDFFNNPACPVGYTAAQPYCWTASSAVFSQGSGFNANQAGSLTFCAWMNTASTSQNVFGGNVCCRVPGR